MRISAGDVANGLACIVFAGIFAFAMVLADLLGFLGLLIIGAITWLVCTRAAQDEDPRWHNGPAWRTTPPEVPSRPDSPEQRAAREATWHARLEPIRFLARCGMALTAIGAAGLACQWWFAAAPNAH